ncbi:hypothetical protein SLEP1_g23183 [Rubroshorea leprosula]|uniref:AGC-kinase C-terminal domain-containing protein n=1 Tax=Rubroshorea leprosula TaxID=152421 RepID=A0AAV5JIT9_9ROSI|nr:hypothetical protein SLEP1_g23183 [Rubroshorea leprosula]
MLCTHQLLCDDEHGLGLGTLGDDQIKAHPWFKVVVWDKIYEMEAAFKPQVTGELDTQNFMNFDELLGDDDDDGGDGDNGDGKQRDLWFCPSSFIYLFILELLGDDDDDGGDGDNGDGKQRDLWFCPSPFIYLFFLELLGDDDDDGGDGDNGDGKQRDLWFCPSPSISVVTEDGDGGGGCDDDKMQGDGLDLQKREESREKKRVCTLGVEPERA